jgi:hypothetical protein
MIIVFQDKEQYQQWIKWQSYSVREKAKKFAEVHGDVIPIVVMIDAYTPQGGEWAPAYIFVHPLGWDELAKWIVE